MSSSTPNPRARPRSSAVVAVVAALLAWCAGTGAAGEPGLSVVAQSPVGGRGRVVADPGGPLPPSAFSVSVDGTPQPVVALPVVSDRLATALVVDASAGSAATLPAGVSGIADFALVVPPAARSALVADTTPPVVVMPLAAGPSAVLGGLSGVAAAGERQTARALDLAVDQLAVDTDTDAPRLVVMWTGGLDAGGPPAADLAARLRAAGVVLAVVVTGDAPAPYWQDVADGTGGVAVAAGPAGAVAAFSTLATALRHRSLLTFPAPAHLPARALVRALVPAAQAGAPERAVTAEASLPDPAVGVAVRPAAASEPPGRSPLLPGLVAAGFVLLLLVAVGLAVRAAGRRRRTDPVTRIRNVPDRAEPVVDRPALLDAISGAFDEGGPVVLTPDGGRAGVGVTTAMVEFAHHHADRYDVAWWVSARDPQLVPDQLAQLAVALGLAGPADPAGDAMAAALAALRGRGRWLVVFDDAESLEDLEGALPDGPGHVLVAATRPSPDAKAVTVAAFTRSESVRLLRGRHPGLPEDVAARVADRLDDLPVAVDVAAAAPDPAGVPDDVWADAFDRLDADDPPALALLTLLAWLGPDPVPLSLLAGEAGTPEEVAARADELRRRALVRVGDGAVLLHPVPAAHLMERTGDDGAGWAARAVRLLRAGLSGSGGPADPADAASWPAWRQVLPHVLAVTDPRRPLDGVHADVGWLLHHAGGFVAARGAERSARALFEDARELGHGP